MGLAQARTQDFGLGGYHKDFAPTAQAEAEIFSQNSQDFNEFLRKIVKIFKRFVRKILRKSMKI